MVNAHSFNLFLGKRNDTPQRPTRVLCCLEIVAHLLLFLVREQQVDVTAVHEIDVIRPSVVLYDAHERRRGVGFDGVRSLRFLGTVLGSACIKIPKGGGSEVAAISTWNMCESVRGRSVGRDGRVASPVAPAPEIEGETSSASHST